MKKEKNTAWSNKEIALMSIGGGTASLGSLVLLYENASTICTLDNLGITMMLVGGAVGVYGSGQLSKPFEPYSEKKRSDSKFSFQLLNDRSNFSSEKKSLATLCNEDTTKWPKDVSKLLKDLKTKDAEAFEADMAKRQGELKERVQALGEGGFTAKGALTALAPKAFVVNYSDPEPSNSSRLSRSARDDTRSRAERFGEEVSMLLSCASPAQDIVLINLTSPGGAVSEFGLAASHLLRLKSAGIRTIVSVDKVAASGGFMMACCADEIVAAPFAFLGSIGVIAEMPNVNKILKKNSVEWLMFTAGEFKRTVTVFGENSEDGKAKFQSDLDNIHEAFKQHVGSNRGDRLDVDQVATGEAWLALQCKEFGLVDRFGTSWDVISDLANEGRDVLLVKRKEPKKLSPFQRLMERTEEASSGAAALFSSLNAHLASISPLAASSSLRESNTPDHLARLGSSHVASSAKF
jgi:signal peptide peptidase SppA